MIKNKFSIIFYLSVLMVLATGCNSDIFLDEPDLSDEVSVTIDGDGGEASFKIPVKGLEHISFDLFSESLKYCTVYNHNGEVIPSESPASMVNKIVFDNDRTRVELIKNGGMLTFISISKTFQSNDLWTIRLEYDYGVRFINIKILGGKPLKLIDVTYDELKIDNRAFVKSNREGFTNKGPLPQNVEIRPYLNELPYILVEPEYSSSWVKWEKLNMPVPVFENGEWELKKMPEITLGSKNYFKGPDRMAKFEIEIPANSHASIFTDVVYSKAEANGVMTFYNETLDRELRVFINATAYYPINHEINVEIKDL